MIQQFNWLCQSSVSQICPESTLFPNKSIKDLWKKENKPDIMEAAFAFSDQHQWLVSINLNTHQCAGWCVCVGGLAVNQYTFPGVWRPSKRPHGGEGPGHLWPGGSQHRSWRDRVLFYPTWEAERAGRGVHFQRQAHGGVCEGEFLFIYFELLTKLLHFIVTVSVCWLYRDTCNST